jgi:hypothetical protein
LPIFRWLLILTLIVLSVFVPKWLPATRNQNACNFVQNVDQQRVSWKGNLPIHFRVHRSVPPEARPAIQRAINMYREVLGREIFVIDNWEADGPDIPQKDGLSTIYWMHTWEADRAKEQARTTLYWNGDQIYEADIRVNAANFRFDFMPGTLGQIDLESLLIHEFGHVLGLTHDPTIGSVMNFSLNEGQIRRHLGIVDLASLHCEY